MAENENSREVEYMESKTFIVDSITFIDDKLDEPITLKEIAAYAGYSEYHFSRLFRKHIGMSVMEYVKKRRLRKACEEIWKGSRILDVALQYGYQSHSGFAKAFKQEFGFSPALLRAMKMQIQCLGGITMRYGLMKQTEEHADKETLYKILQDEVTKAGIHFDESKGRAVYDFACQSYEKIKRYSGDEYVTHPLHVAIILAQMGAEENVILAGMLCDVLKKKEITEKELHGAIPEEVAEVVIKLQDFNVSKASLPGADEPVIMVKLAERLHNMRTAEYVDEKQQVDRARETLEWFMPFAGKMGNEELSAELNDLALKYLSRENF